LTKRTEFTEMESTEPAAKRLVAKIDGARLEGERTFVLAVTDLRPVRPRAGWYHLTVALTDAKSESSRTPKPPRTPKPSRTPLMTGLVSGGGRLVMPWFEARLFPMVETADGTTIDARAKGLEAAFVDLLGTLVPPGGHLMIEYESPGQHETHEELLLRVPPVASYLGSLMFHAGFRGEFKDWYISEGGHEGPRKLQANKSPTPAAARAAMRNHLRDLTAFVKRPLPDRPEDAAVIKRAQARARALLKELRR
jgi:hypothetical protein